MNIHDILLKKAANQELGHFYIIETSAPEETSFNELFKFINGFIRDYFQKVEGHKKQGFTRLMDHPDVFILGNTDELQEDKDKFFKVDDAESLNRFFEFKPVQGSRKFAVITEAHRINTIVANKWLKLLEEPLGNSTIFLLNPRRSRLLPTIHSRAIHLRLPTQSSPSDFSEWNEMLKELSQMPLSSFLDRYAKGERDLSFWVNELIRWESEQIDQPAPKEQLGKWLRAYNEMETFHQPHATKWALFYSHVRENVLPRLN